MKNIFIEATNGPNNWGKFMVARFDDEWQRRSVITDAPLLRTIGWAQGHILVCDLQTGEGAFFYPGGEASYDLNKHRVWVCPLFEPFLAWLYKQDLSDLDKLPKSIDLPEAEFRMYGHRRTGPGFSEKDAKEFLVRKGYLYADMEKHPELLVEFARGDWREG